MCKEIFLVSQKFCYSEVPLYNLYSTVNECFSLKTRLSKCYKYLSPKVQTTPQEMEASTTTTDSDATTSRVESSDSVSPDTQTLRDHTPNDQTPPPSSMGVADLPATIPADTTSDEATEPVDETGLTSSNVVYEDDNEVMNDNEDMLEDNNHNQEDEEEGDGEEMVVLATEPLESASVDAPAHSREECDEGERGREGEEEESQEDEGM